MINASGFEPALVQTTSVRIPVTGAVLEGDMAVPPTPRGLIVFAHGTGSNRQSPRNRFVAERLHRHGFGTLLIDLLTPSETSFDERTARHRFDITLLAHRVTAVVDWTRHQSDLLSLPIGLFGASTGAAAALVAAADRPRDIGAVVSRGGRPDLAGSALARLVVPTLLLVGALDATVLDMNRDAQRRMRTRGTLDIVPGASHLFEEPGALDDVAVRTAEWFRTHLRRGWPRHEHSNRA